MNKFKKLWEGLFDDDFNEISNETTITDSHFERQDDKLILLAGDIILHILKEWYSHSNYFNYNFNKIYFEKEDNTVKYYLYDLTKNKKYLYDIHLKSLTNIHLILQIFDLLYKANIKKLAIDFILTNNAYNDTGDTSDISKNIIDFHNIILPAISCTKINLQNLVIDKNAFNNIINFPDNISIVVSFNKCIINDTININNILTIFIESCLNIKDYSFIKNIEHLCEIKFYNKKHVAKTNNLTGLPEGHYKLEITYYNNNASAYVDMETLTLVGIPKNLAYLKLDTYVNPTLFLYKLSFEGLTIDYLNKFTFKAHHFLGREHDTTIQFGPFNITFVGRTWSPNKPHLKYVLNTHDWFLDCYESNPHKNYKYTNDKLNISNDIKTIYNKTIEENKSKQEDYELMVKNIKKYCTVNSTFYSRWTLKITDITDNDISIHVVKRFGEYDYTYSFKQFISFLKDKHFRLSKDENSPMLSDLIITSVEKRREQKKQQQKEEKKKLRKIQREEKKKEKELLKKQNKKELKVPKFNVTIVDYTDKAIAIFGDTFQIRTLLKELGAKFNKYLTKDNKKTPGWILSKKKKVDVEKIIYGD